MNNPSSTSDMEEKTQLDSKEESIFASLYRKMFAKQ
jgi:hypothetical protein